MYKKLEIDFEITEELEKLIDEYVHHLNTGEGLPDDYYRTEIQLELNFCVRERLLNNEQIKLLRDYYQYRGIERNNNGSGL